MENKVYIYALKDPFTNEVRYIGQSYNPVSRLRAHLLSREGTAKDVWVSLLIERKAKPILEIIEDCIYEKGAERERYHIAAARASGSILFNKSAGGAIGFSRNGGTVHISATIKRDTYDRIVKLAKEEKRTFSQVVALYLEKIVLQEQAVKPKK